MTNSKQARVLTLMLLAASLTLAAVAQPGDKGTLIEFTAPGAATVTSAACGAYCGTFGYANNNYGDIVGTYTDTNVIPHGFLRRADGKFVSFDAPGAGLGAGLDEGTAAIGINDLGEIAGQYEDSNFVFHGFVRYIDGSFATFEAPGAGTGPNQGTFAYDINLEGETAGVYFDSNNVEHGFVRSPSGSIATIDPTGSIGTMVCEETCLNLEGIITGFFLDANNTFHGFVRQPDGTITQLDAPGAGTGNYLGTVAASINPEGGITGYFVNSNSVAYGFVRTFDSFTTFEVPGASTGAGQGTAAFSINLPGAVTGEFFDSNNAMHGFSRSARGAIATITAPGAGTGAGQGTRPSTNNVEGVVTVRRCKQLESRLPVDSLADRVSRPVSAGTPLPR